MNYASVIFTADDRDFYKFPYTHEETNVSDQGNPKSCVNKTRNLYLCRSLFTLTAVFQGETVISVNVPGLKLGLCFDCTESTPSNFFVSAATR